MEAAIDNNGKYKGKAFILSILLYICFLGALYFFKIIYEPIEEPMAMGVDLNYGVDLVGSGNVQTLNHANASKNNYDVKPEENKTPNTKVTATPPPPERVKSETKVIAKTPPVITADEDTKVSMNKSTEKPTKTSPKPSTVNTKGVVNSPAPVAKVPARVVDQGSMFKKPGTSTGSNGTVGTKSGVGGNNNGDGKNGQVGDQGSPKGTLDGKSLYGNPGGGTGKNSGASVNISGWKNRGPLNITKDNSSETGRIRFRVVVDDFGDIVKIDLLESSVSPSITNYYKSQITQKLKSNLIPEGNPPPRSTGTITINITRG